MSEVHNVDFALHPAFMARRCAWKRRVKQTTTCAAYINYQGQLSQQGSRPHLATKFPSIILTKAGEVQCDLLFNNQFKILCC